MTTDVCYQHVGAYCVIGDHGACDGTCHCLLAADFRAPCECCNGHGPDPA